MNLGKSFSSIEVKKSGYNAPECKGYEFVILSVIDSPSKAGNPMLRFDVDIASGDNEGGFSKFPQRYYQVYGTDDALSDLKGIFNNIIAENISMFPEDDPFATGAFDEQRLVGCKVGGVLKWSPEGYLNLNYFTSVERALAAPVIQKPTTVAPKKTNPVVGGAGESAWGIGS